MAAAVAAMAIVPAELHPQSETARARRAQPAPRRDRPAGSGDIIIPFTIGPPRCVNRTRVYVVSMRIHNVLAQPVGIPTLAAAAAPSPPDTAERSLTNLRLSCGRYLARWNGRHVTTGRKLPPGIYLTELVIDGLRITRKVTLDG